MIDRYLSTALDPGWPIGRLLIDSCVCPGLLAMHLCFKHMEARPSRKVATTTVGRSSSQKCLCFGLGIHITKHVSSNLAGSILSRMGLSAIDWVLCPGTSDGARSEAWNTTKHRDTRPAPILVRTTTPCSGKHPDDPDSREQPLPNSNHSATPRCCSMSWRCGGSMQPSRVSGHRVRSCCKFSFLHSTRNWMVWICISCLRRNHVVVYYFLRTLNRAWSMY